MVMHNAKILCTVLVLMGGGLSLPGTTSFGNTCSSIIALEERVMALSSDERGYAEKSPTFAAAMQQAIKMRGEFFCKDAGCGSLEHMEVEELSSKKPIAAKTIINLKLPDLIFSRTVHIPKSEQPSKSEQIPEDFLQPRAVMREFSMEKSWYFGNNGSRRLGNAMWHMGKVITLLSPLGFLAGPAAVIITPLLVALGGSTTLLSRYVERTPITISLDHAIRRLEGKKKINKVSTFFGERIPHLLFKHISCQEKVSLTEKPEEKTKDKTN